MWFLYFFATCAKQFLKLKNPLASTQYKRGKQTEKMCVKLESRNNWRKMALRFTCRVVDDLFHEFLLFWCKLSHEFLLSLSRSPFPEKDHTKQDLSLSLSPAFGYLTSSCNLHPSFTLQIGKHFAGYFVSKTFWVFFLLQLLNLWRVLHSSFTLQTGKQEYFAGYFVF